MLTVRLHRLDFYVVLRKLIAELQAFPKSIQKASMVRFYSSIYADDELLIRQMSCDSAFHGIVVSWMHLEKACSFGISFRSTTSRCVRKQAVNRTLQ